MSTAVAQPETLSRTELGEHVVLGGIAFTSFSALLLELSLTRLFSVVLFYHFAFLAISIALLGLGAGGVFAHIWKRRIDQFKIRQIAMACSLLSGLAIPAVLEVILHLPVSLDLTGKNFLRLSVIYLCAAVPFFLTGVQFSAVFARETARIPRLYCADLAGGALACLAVVPLLNWIGGPNAVLFAALSSAGAAVVWSPGSGLRRATSAVAILLAVAIVGNRSGRLIDVTWAKGVRRNNVEFSRWNAISRVEVDRGTDGSRVIVIDADANTYIMNADPQRWQGSIWEKDLMSAPPAVVNALRPNGEYAIIGPGGGVDVLRAVASGADHVMGIEINPIIADTIMRDRYADFAYHLYDRPGVEIHVGDGRSFIRNAKSKFDVVQMTLVDTWASTAAGAFALSENNLYTTEAFREYFDHLKPDGIIAVTRWEFQQPREALRVVSVAMEALRQLGVRNAPGHFIVVSQGNLNRDGIPVAVLAKKGEFTSEEETTVRRHLLDHGPLALLYSPSQPGKNAFTSLISSNDPAGFTQNYEYKITAASDDAPFFFFTLKPGKVLDALANSKAMDWKVNLGVAVLGMVFVISVAAVFLFLVAPMLLSTRNNSSREVGALLYFIAVGLGYILTEVALIQRFVLFLGHPTYALTVVVFLMLLSSAAGSLMSRRWLKEIRRVWLPLAVIIAGLLMYVAVLPRALNSLVGASFVVKLMVCGCFLVPLGVVMGIPFPTGLRALEGRSIEWAWALNAAASVLGSVLAIALAIQFGLNLTLTCAALAYLFAWLLRPKLHAPQSRA